MPPIPWVSLEPTLTSSRCSGRSRVRLWSWVPKMIRWWCRCHGKPLVPTSACCWWRRKTAATWDGSHGGFLCVFFGMGWYDQGEVGFRCTQYRLVRKRSTQTVYIESFFLKNNFVFPEGLQVFQFLGEMDFLKQNTWGDFLVRNSLPLKRSKYHLFVSPKTDVDFTIILYHHMRLQVRTATFFNIPSWELTYPLKSPFWRWFSFSQGGIC